MADFDTDTPVAEVDADAAFAETAAWGADSVTHEALTADPDAAAVDETPATDTPPAEAAPVDDLAAEEPKGKKGKPRNDPRARVEQATAREAAAKEEARLARERADRLEAELAEARKPKPAADPPARPTLVTPPQTAAAFAPFDAWLEKNPGKDYDDYRDARDEHLRTSWWQSQQAQFERQGAMQAHSQRIKQAIETDPSLPQLITSGTQAIAAELQKVGIPDLPEVIAQALVNSPRSVDAYRYLLTHPAETAQLALDVMADPSASPVVAARLVRRYFDSVTAGAAVPPDSASVVRPSSARAPINRVGGTASATPVSSDDLEFGPEYIQVENEKDKKRRASGRRW
jgi:hypothetical protein